MWFFPSLLLSSSWDQCLFRQKNRPAIFFRAAAPRLSLSLFRRGKKKGVGWFLKVEEEEQADASIMPGGAKTLPPPPPFAFLFSNEEGLLAPPPFRSFFSLAEEKASCQKIRTRKEGIVYLELLISTMQKKLFLRFEVKNTSALY